VEYENDLEERVIVSVWTTDPLEERRDTMKSVSYEAKRVICS
jgi:hypothetical protein